MSRALLFLEVLDCSFAPFAEAAAAPLDGGLELASCSGADALPIGVDMILLSIHRRDIARFTCSLDHFYVTDPPLCDH